MLPWGASLKTFHFSTGQLACEGSEHEGRVYTLCNLACVDILQCTLIIYINWSDYIYIYIYIYIYTYIKLVYLKKVIQVTPLNKTTKK